VQLEEKQLRLLALDQNDVVALRDEGNLDIKTRLTGTK